MSRMLVTQRRRHVMHAPFGDAFDPVIVNLDNVDAVERADDGTTRLIWMSAQTIWDVTSPFEEVEQLMAEVDA